MLSPPASFPVRRSKGKKCQGQTRMLPLTLPSASGPRACGQRGSKATTSPVWARRTTATSPTPGKRLQRMACGASSSEVQKGVSATASLRVSRAAFFLGIGLGVKPVGGRMKMAAARTSTPRRLRIKGAHALLREGDEVLVIAPHLEIRLAEPRRAFGTDEQACRLTQAVAEAADHEHVVVRVAPLRA